MSKTQKIRFVSDNCSSKCMSMDKEGERVVQCRRGQKPFFMGPGINWRIGYYIPGLDLEDVKLDCSSKQETWKPSAWWRHQQMDDIRGWRHISIRRCYSLDRKPVIYSPDWQQIWTTEPSRGPPYPLLMTVQAGMPSKWTYWWTFNRADDRPGLEAVQGLHREDR